MSYKMYYNRILSDSFSSLIEPNGKIRWLFEFVKNHNDLDFLLGKNNNKEWISIYRGLSRILCINKSNDIITLTASEKFKNINPQLYKKSINDNFKSDLEILIKEISEQPIFDRYYNNKREGFYQNSFSRRFGICSLESDDFVIVDKEVVVGYESKKDKSESLTPFQEKYKKLQNYIYEKNPIDYGNNLYKKSFGNELDFLGLDKEGNILLIEFKDRINTNGIYLSPLQIGMYFDIFNEIEKSDLVNSIYEMINQKQKIGLINPQWKAPKQLKDIIPVLVISNYNNKSTAKDKFNEILEFSQKQLGSDYLINLRKYNYNDNAIYDW